MKDKVTDLLISSTSPPREIKFRAWHQPTQTMVPNASTGTLKVFTGLQEYESFECLFMQYTGLKDKNSKEIYEGDIVLQTHPHPDDKDDVALVKYGEHISADPHHYGGWTIGFYAGDPEAAFSLLEKENRFEVIGNIYENPELIQQAV